MTINPFPLIVWKGNIMNVALGSLSIKEIAKSFSSKDV